MVKYFQLKTKVNCFHLNQGIDNSQMAFIALKIDCIRLQSLPGNHLQWTQYFTIRALLSQEGY